MLVHPGKAPAALAYFIVTKGGFSVTQSSPRSMLCYNGKV